METNHLAANTGMHYSLIYNPILIFAIAVRHYKNTEEANAWERDISIGTKINHLNINIFLISSGEFVITSQTIADQPEPNPHPNSLRGLKTAL